jgi:hypothetical protein
MRISNKVDILSTIESSNYVATVDQVEALARTYQASDEQAQRARGSYLRILVAALQVHLGMSEPRITALRGKLPSVSDVNADLAALNIVHVTYYEAIQRVIITPDVADAKGLKMAERKRRALVRNSRSAFARTSKSTLAAYIRAGGNVRALNVLQLTKASLREWTSEHASGSGLTFEQRAARFANRVVKQLAALSEEDTDLANRTMNACISRLTDAANTWTPNKQTSSVHKAMQEGLPLRTEEGIFWPVIHEPGNGPPTNHAS